MGKTKVTIDTNILVSGFGWKGNPHRVLDMVVRGEIELFTSREQFEELSRVLDYPKFEFSDKQKVGFKSLLSSVASFVETATELDIIKEDPTDNRILECAMVADVDFIVSGDEHLLSIKKFGRIEILTASEFLKSIR
ncbi:MAG: putative toxin-antitoxin system toxin component, PIN family [Nitrososphaerales archaeon]